VKAARPVLNGEDEETGRKVLHLVLTQHHHTGAVLAYVFGRRKDAVFLQLKTLLEPFGLTRFYTDHWGAYTRHLDADVHSPGKRNTQKIERKHLTLRTRIKRLVRKTICFSKTTQMHDIVIGLFVNRYAFGLLV
jgi:insertion element IS1 protein InsB